MNQLVQPNLSAVGRVGWCLEYIARVYGTTQLAPYAWTAWQQTQFKHTDPIPGDVSVPCWFSFYSGGINQGHVVASVPGQGFYSSPWQQNTSHAVLPSIAEVERLYGAKYVGWSEDILSKRIVEGDTMTKNEAYTVTDGFYRWGTGAPPTPELSEYWASRMASIPTGVQELYEAMKKEAQSSTGYTPYTGDPLFTKAKK